MEGKDNIQRPYKGLFTDNLQTDQPEGTYPFALNALNQTINGNANFLSMENAIKACTSFPVGSTPIGKCYLFDDNIAVWLKGSGNKDYIGILNKYNQFEIYVETEVLGLSKEYPVNATFRLRRNNSKVVYWVDGNNHPRTFNFDRVSDFYSVDYKEYLDNLLVGQPDTYSGEKWESLHFDLIKGYSFIPHFSAAEIIEGGNVSSGSYSISVQLVDANLNPTEWITTSNPVNIYVDSTFTEYSNVRGSRNIDNYAQFYANATKSIKWTINNIDPNFSYYRVAVLIANAGDGSVNQVLVSELRTVDNPTFIYTGSVDSFTETSLSDIYDSKIDIDSAKYITQLENRLILGNVKGTQINWCNFQKYASKIRSKVMISGSDADDISYQGNPKNPVTPFYRVGYMSDEVYSFGIVYIIDGGLESPVFHIPGRPENFGSENGFQFYENDDGSRYIPVDVCLSEDYWGYDGYGEPLINQKVRHHRFPKRDFSLVSTYGLSYFYAVQFENIEKPHPDVIGYKIVRNERTDDDKLIFDNAVVGPLSLNNEYHAFGLLSPNKANTALSSDGVYIFSPEHQFFHKPANFDEIEVVGILEESSKFVPSVTDDIHGTGAYINDVSPGTSYNPEFHKAGESDPDGFSLQVMYRSKQMAFTLGNPDSIELPQVASKYHIAAAGHVLSDDKIFFNASTDNKIIIAEFTEPITDNSFFTSPNKLLYVSLKRNNTSAYSGFMTRPYYKEHNNPFYFDNDIESTPEIANGDTYVNPMTIVSTMYVDTVFADRAKKSKVWKIIAGAALIIGGILLAVFTEGAGSALSAKLIEAGIMMAIAGGISLAVSGIKFEVMKNMIDEHYEAGLKDCVEDDDNYITKNPADGTVTGGTFDPPTGGWDDTFCWFADRLNNIYFESSVNIGLRSGITVGLTDFVNSPSPQPANASNAELYTASREIFESYLINKLTVIDRQQGDGRLYIGYPTSEYYDMNLDYLRKNKEKIYNYLPLEYDCCADDLEDFRDRVHYSEQSYQEEVLDNFRVFLTNNYKDIEGNTGEITNLFRYNNSLYIHTSEALYHLPQNLQERANTDLVTFIGTGDFFSIPPRKVLDGVDAIAGSKHHQATVVTPHGVFFVSETEGKVYLMTDRPQNITTGNENYFKNNLKMSLHKSIADNIGKDYVNDYDNVFSDKMVGIHSVYDNRYERIIMTKIDYLPLQSFELFTGNNSIGSFVYDADTKEFGIINELDAFERIPFSNTNYFENKSFTISYSFKTQMWVSWHSYLPMMYMSTPNMLYSFVENDNTVYLHNNKEAFCEFYGNKYPFIVEVTSVSNPIATRIWNHISMVALVRRYHSTYETMVYDYEHFFETLTINNERQLSGKINLKVKTAKPNPEDWFSQQVVDVQNEAIVNRVEDTWFINDFRDYISDEDMPLFLKAWDSIKSEFPIDKIINPLAISVDKNWNELESFRGKFLTMRFSYLGTESDGIQITLNYVIDNEQFSIR